MNERAPFALIGKYLRFPGVLIISFCIRDRIAGSGYSAGCSDNGDFNGFSAADAVSAVVGSGVERAEVERVGKRLRKRVGIDLCIVQFVHCVFSFKMKVFLYV